MLLKCHRPTLVSALQIVSAVVPTRTPREVLKNIKLTVTSGHVVLIGTDQEIGIRQDVDQVQTDSSGEVLLPTSRVISILRELQDDEVTLEATDRAIVIKGGHSNFSLSTEEPAEFPPVAEFTDSAYFTTAADRLRLMIRRTIFATDVDSTRYALGGVLMELDAEKVTLAATDSRRLAVISQACQAVGAMTVENSSPVIPSKAMQLIERSLPENDSPVQIAVHTNHILVKCGGSTIYSRLVEGRFPRYSDVIPTQFSTSIELVAAPFYAAVRQAQIVTSEESRGVNFEFRKGILSLSSRAADIGQSTIDLPIGYDGADLGITFDPRYIADFLRILDGSSTVTVNLIDSESPAVFQTEDGYRYVVMPLARDQ